MFCPVAGMSTGSLAAAVACVLAGAAVVAGHHFSRRVSEPGRKTVEEAIESEAEKGHLDKDAYAALRGERVSLASPFGY